MIYNAAGETGEIGKTYLREEKERDSLLDSHVRQCFAYSAPDLLRDRDTTTTDKIQRANQSFTTTSTNSLASLMVRAIFPVGFPFWITELSDQIENHPNVKGNPAAEAEILRVRALLSARDMHIMQTLESDEMETQRFGPSFRSVKYQVMRGLIAGGDTLEMIDENYHLRQYPRNRHVTRRDANGNVLHHITEVPRDVTGMSSEFRDKAGIRDDSPEPGKKVYPLFTRCLWQPDTQKWLVEQEINGRVIYGKEMRVSPFFSTTFTLVPEEHYGRGLIETVLEDIRLYDLLHTRGKEMLAQAVKQLIALNRGSTINPKDLLKAPGSIVAGCDVQQGVAQDVGIIAFSERNVHATNLVSEWRRDLKQDLSIVFGNSAEVTEFKERVTATQVRQEIDRASQTLGALFLPIADMQQTNLRIKVEDMMIEDGLIPKVEDLLGNIDVPGGATRVVTRTGLAAAERADKLETNLRFMEVLRNLPPEQLAQDVNIGAMIRETMRLMGVDIPGLIKSEEQKQQEAAQAAQMRVEENAANAVVDAGREAAVQEAKAAGAEGAQ